MTETSNLDGQARFDPFLDGFVILHQLDLLWQGVECDAKHGPDLLLHGRHPSFVVLDPALNWNDNRTRYWRVSDKQSTDAALGCFINRPFRQLWIISGNYSASEKASLQLSLCTWPTKCQWGGGGGGQGAAAPLLKERDKNSGHPVVSQTGVDENGCWRKSRQKRFWEIDILNMKI